MARPSKNAPIDFSVTHDLTHGLLSRAICPEEVSFVKIKDADKKGLRLRVTKAGGKHWQFETRIKGKLFTRALGEWPAVSIDQAKSEAHRLRGLTERGLDPRQLEKVEEAEKSIAIAEAEAKKQTEKISDLLVGDVWQLYIEERRPYWGEEHYKDHIRKAAKGGESYKRGTGVTNPGPLYPFMKMRLKDLTPSVIESWAVAEAKDRPTSARLAWRCLKVFLGWCQEHPIYSLLVSTNNPAKTRKTREAFGKPKAKTDALQREQLCVWFESVRNISNKEISCYLQVLLLTGARPGEVIKLQWADVDFQWKKISIRDKVEGSRVIPLTPYVAFLLSTLNRQNQWVFASSTSSSGHLTEPNHVHTKACKVAGLEGLTLHGLRRSFKSLTEWIKVPMGIVAQIMGHKPSATAEKHYAVRTIDLLRESHEEIEVWILEQAGVHFDPKAVQNGLRLAA